MCSIKTRNWNKYIKLCIIVVCVLLMLPALTSCISAMIYSILTSHRDGKYDGDYPELYSIAINSVLGAKGYTPDGHGLFPSNVAPLEEDSLGRVMFLYHENNQISKYSLIISQKNDKEYAYYYPDYNFISISHSNKLFLAAFDTSYYSIFGPNAKHILDIVSEKFNDEEVKKLKRKNDWNMNIDIDKCEKVEIARQKAKGPVKSSIVEKFCGKILGDHRTCSYSTFFAKDDYNRSMYVGTKWNRGEGVIVMFFRPDFSYDEKNGVMELTDLNNYQDDLKAFKERNKWNVKP